MTKAALEAAVNALLAPNQPITANGQHKPSMQQVINEMYDAQSRGDVLAGVSAVLSLMTGDQVFIVRAGVAKLVPATVFADGAGSRPSFADWDASVDAMPTDSDAIGSGTDGAILKGDMVIFTDVFPDGGNNWPVDTIGIAKQDSPTTTAHWRLI